MAATYIYGLTSDDVLAELPGIDTNNVAVSTDLVTTTAITTWLNDGAGRLNAVLDKSGVTASATMDADTHQLCAVAVKNYAIMKALLRLRDEGPALEMAREEWTAIYTEISNRPQQLGDAYGDGLTIAADSLSSYSDTQRKDAIDSDVPVDEWLK